MKTLVTAILFLVAAFFVGHMPSEGIAGMLTWFAIPETSGLQIAHGFFLILGFFWVAGMLRSSKPEAIGSDGVVR